MAGMRTIRCRPILAALALLAGLAGCAGVEPRTAVQTPGAAAIASPIAAPGERIATLARDLVGTPYRYGGTDPSGFDCSGLVYWSYRQAGFSIPRTSQAQFKAAAKIALSRAEAGDLMFFQDQEKLSHVGIYLGAGLFVHAPATGARVAVASLDTPYYQEHLVAVGRLLGP